MERKGIVRFLNLLNGLVAVETSDGFVVFEILERCAIDMGDVVTDFADSPGREVLFNISKRENFEVYVQAMNCSRSEAVHLLE